MQTKAFSYLFSISYFGARYKGWAIQKGQPTIQGKLERVLRFILGHDDFTLLGGSRTDSGVSCREGFFQLFLSEKNDFSEQTIAAINENLGGEILIQFIGPVRRDFNLIKASKRKIYRYFFTDSAETPALHAAWLQPIFKKLDLGRMNEAAKIFQGNHDFSAFCTPSPTKTDFEREILQCQILLSDEIPYKNLADPVYYLEVVGTGFLHHQVRKMMRAIWYVGSGQWDLAEIENRLKRPSQDWEKIPPAPALGLVLWGVDLDHE
ncbi:MAG: tRNA pseudouridine(38-40) synthase TruA [Algoriphagus sp.]|uniref:tRNA pseudouridine(38-40) synthase TruA n=1 Tax=Algoriphagus sp. TaxID=1872435 RepID=UPI0017CF25C1|nr:tRNA pseudouridine(38-40) synthase TruA [Algoriphagus sp.]NVJ86398.1 tRNA pseudouridine(38-40) synthase TruA [Algoriphagus sp.]